MLEVLVTREFEERYWELSEIIRKRAEKQEKIFKDNPFYPLLHTEKLKPKNKEVWSFRIDKKYRIIFRSVGSHDWIYKLKF